MTSRKRRSETAVVNKNNSQEEEEYYDNDDAAMKMTGDNDESSSLSVLKQQASSSSSSGKSKIRVRIRRFHGVAQWTWNAGSDDEVCGICQSAFEGVAPGVKFPGDECPVVFGKCGHAFHLQCVSQWLNSSRNTCPICRREWEFGQSSDQRGRTDAT